MREASIDVDSVPSHPYRGNMKTKKSKTTKRNVQTNGGAKPNVRFNNFEKRSTYEAVSQLAKTGSQSMKSACEKLRLMGWDKHELDAR